MCLGLGFLGSGPVKDRAMVTLRTVTNAVRSVTRFDDVNSSVIY